MADWSPLRRLLADVDERRTFRWAELDDLVGGLPPSAYAHAAFWKGDRIGWSGFRTEDVRVGTSVTFVRRSAMAALPGTGCETATRKVADRRGTETRGDVLLVSCVKQKLNTPAPAKDLYTSPLFRKQRTYAEAAGVPWFILSAQHGLVAPEQQVAPYELRLSSLSRSKRGDWGRAAVARLLEVHGPVDGQVVEIHAGAIYADAIRGLLLAHDALVVEPLQGLLIGERLAWYGRRTVSEPAAARSPTWDVPTGLDVAELVERLTDDAHAVTPAAFIAQGRSGLQGPGLYSWWVDAEGAVDLARGLGQPVEAGLIYAGLAGATRSLSGKRSKNTLWGRINGMHLGSRHELSTFRLSLGSILAEGSAADSIDEQQLTDWMHAHLRVVAVPVDDADTLDGMETSVLAVLNPPFNLQKMPPSAIRARLTELRRRYSNKVRRRTE